MRRLELAAVLAVVSAAAIGFGLGVSPKETHAHTYDLGFHWFNNAYQYENAYDSTGGGGWSVSAGATDWYNNSLLWTNMDPNATYYEIDFQAADYGATGWLGAAYVYSNNYTCVSPSVTAPGGCNKSTEPATTAVLALNTYYAAAGEIALRPAVSRHELGHVFGLAHHSTVCENILMDRGNCAPHASSVQTHDAELVDLLY